MHVDRFRKFNTSQLSLSDKREYHIVKNYQFSSACPSFLQIHNFDCCNRFNKCNIYNIQYSCMPQVVHTHTFIFSMCIFLSLARRQSVSFHRIFAQTRAMFYYCLLVNLN